MYDGSYSAIINRVQEIRGNQVGGFIGKYDYKIKDNYMNRVISFTNISSYAKVYGAVGKRNALLVGGLEGIKSENSKFNTFNIQNVFVMGHLYTMNNNSVESEKKDHLIIDINESELMNLDVNQRYLYAHCYDDSCTNDTNDPEQL